MPFLQTKDKTLHYQLKAHSAPEDILFLHGNLSSNRWWEPTLKELKDLWGEGEGLKGQLALMEWLGCGQSRGQIGPQSLEMRSLARDYIHFCHTAGLSEVHLVGHSTGGLIALYCLLEEPGLFSKALLLDPVGPRGIKLGPEMDKAFEQMKESRDFCASVMAGTIHGVKPEDPFFQSLVDDAFGVQEEIWQGVPKALEQVDIFPELKKIHHPVMVLHGEFDTILPLSDSQELAKNLPAGQFKKLKGQGHSTNVENPRLLAQEILDFF